MHQLGMQIVREKKLAVMDSLSTTKGITTHDVQGRDLLSLLIKANMASDIPLNQRMTDEDVLARTSIFNPAITRSADHISSYGVKKKFLRMPYMYFCDPRRLKNLFALDFWQQGTAPLAHQLHGVYSILQEPPVSKPYYAKRYWVFRRIHLLWKISTDFPTWNRSSKRLCAFMARCLCLLASRRRMMSYHFQNRLSTDMAKSEIA